MLSRSSRSVGCCDPADHNTLVSCLRTDGGVSGVTLSSIRFYWSDSLNSVSCPGRTPYGRVLTRDILQGQHLCSFKINIGVILYKRNNRYKRKLPFKSQSGLYPSYISDQLNKKVHSPSGPAYQESTSPISYSNGVRSVTDLLAQ